MANTRKPTERRQGRNATPDIGLVHNDQIRSIPPAPHPSARKLLRVVEHAWSEFWSSDLSCLVTPADMPALRRLFQAYDLRERLQRILLADPMTTGSTGQLKVNPAAAEIASLDGRILALEDRFGLSPSARLKLGVTFGAAARSLEELNRGFDDDIDEDPRVRIIDASTA